MKRIMTLTFLVGATVVCLGLSLPADVGKYSEWMEVRNLGDVVNSPGPPPGGEDVTPFLSRDGLSLYFVSTRPGGYGDLDLYVSTRESRTADWGPPQNLGPNVNSADRAYWPTLSPDGHRLYFAVTPVVPGGYGDFDLYVSRRHDKKDDLGWEPAMPVAELNTAGFHDVSLVFFEEDDSGDLMGYFASARPTGPDDVLYDENLYVTRLQEDGTFAPPTLVPGLNTDDYSERLATVRRDGLEVFFSRALPTEQVGLIVSATRESQTDAWSEPVAVPYPVNDGISANMGPRLSFDGTELYFASSRKNLFTRPFLDVNVATRSKLKGR